MLRNSTQYNLAGSKFLRLGSRSILNIFGSNLQNVEKSLRRMYHADDGMILNQRDQSGAEALVVAYLTKHGQFRDLFLNGVKPHVFVALHLFRKVWEDKIQQEGLDIKCDINELCNTSIPNLRKNPWWREIDKLIKSSDNWPPSERYYYIAKQVCHSSNYGIRAGMFCLNTLEKSRGKIALKKRDAEMFLEMYHSLFPEIRQWHYEVERQVKETRILYNLLGDPIQFTGDLETESAIKEAFACIPQSTVAGINRQAFTKMQEFIEDTRLNWDMLADTHDSLMSQSPIQEHLECHKIMKQFIEPTLENFKGEKFQMKSEGASGYNWAPYHETKNPEGLKEVLI